MRLAGSNQEPREDIRRELSSHTAVRILSGLLSDVRFSARSLLRKPTFGLTAVLATAVGVGATTAIFSVVDGVLLRPLPYADTDNVVTLWSVTPDGDPGGSPSFPDFQDWQARSTSFEATAFVRGAALTHLDDVDGAAIVLTAFVTPGFVAALAPPTHLGSLAPLADGATTEEVIALKYSTWRTRFKADSTVVGRLETFSDGAYRVVAVLAPGVDYPLWGEAYARLTPERVTAHGLDVRDYRVDTRVLARLKQGVGVQGAQVEMDALAARLAETYPDSNQRWGVLVRPLRNVLLGDVEASLWVLLGAVTALLFIACANVAILSLARTLDRAHELGLRASLGASRGRLAVLLGMESLMVAAVGGLAGVFLARWSVGAFLAWGVPGLPRSQAIAVDARILVFATVVSLAAGALFGLAPSLLASRTNLMSSLRAGTSHRRSERLRTVLVAGQVAVTVALVATTGLLGRSFQRLQGVERGFEVGDLVTLRLNLPAAYDGNPGLRAALFTRILQAAGAEPAIASATMVNHAPLSGTGILTPLVVEGGDPETTPRAWLRTAGPDYFQVLGIPVVAGRAFDPADDEGGTGSVVVSARLASQLWGDADPIGRRLTLYRQISADADYGQPMEGVVVGVVGNTLRSLRADGPTAAVYVPMAAHPWPSAYLVVRPRPGGSVVNAIGNAVRGAEPQIPVTDIQPFSELAQISVGRDRFLATLSVTFSVLAMFLALVGTYGALSYAVRRKLPDLAIEMALGSGQGRMMGRVLRQAAIVVGAGAAVGLLAAIFISRYVASVLFRTSPLDPVALGGSVLVVMLMGLLGAWLPARTAAKADCLSVLRGPS